MPSVPIDEPVHSISRHVLTLWQSNDGSAALGRVHCPPPEAFLWLALPYSFSYEGIPTLHRLTSTLGPPKHTVEVIGEPNRSATVRMTQYNGSNKSSEKAGDVPKYESDTDRVPSLY